MYGSRGGRAPRRADPPAGFDLCFGRNSKDLGSFCARRLDRGAWIPAPPPGPRDAGIEGQGRGVPSRVRRGGLGEDAPAAAPPKAASGGAGGHAAGEGPYAAGTWGPQRGQMPRPHAAGCGARPKAARAAYMTPPVPGGPAGSATAKGAGRTRPYATAPNRRDAAAAIGRPARPPGTQGGRRAKPAPGPACRRRPRGRVVRGGSRARFRARFRAAPPRPKGGRYSVRGPGAGRMGTAGPGTRHAAAMPAPWGDSPAARRGMRAGGGGTAGADYSKSICGFWGCRGRMRPAPCSAARTSRRMRCA